MTAILSDNKNYLTYSHKIDRAKRADFPKLLQALGFKLSPSGNSFFSLDHDSLKFFPYQGIWLYKWFARQGEVGNAIQFLVRYAHFSFKNAIEILSLFPLSKLHSSQNQINKKSIWPSIQWQIQSQKLVLLAHSFLFSSQGKNALDFLMFQRGLTLQSIQQHRLGWLPQNNTFPSKILIPCYNNKKNLFRIRFRIDHPASHHERYKIKKGSHPTQPFPLNLSPHKPLILVESELDAILLYQESNNAIGVLALGSTASKLSPEKIHFLNQFCPAILISMDNDSAGRIHSAQLLSQLHNAFYWPIPIQYGKDPGEAWKKLNLKSWMEDGLKAKL